MLQFVVLAPFSQGPFRKSSAAEITDPVLSLLSPLTPGLSLSGATFLFSKESYFPRTHGILETFSQDLCYLLQISVSWPSGKYWCGSYGA